MTEPINQFRKELQQVADPSEETLEVDCKLLDEILSKESIEHLVPGAFKNFHWRLAQGLALSVKQHDWVRRFYEKFFDKPQYENLVSSGKAPRGREVTTPECLWRENLPLRPPGR